MATKITSRVLADDAIVRATLGDDAIGVAEIADDAVTSAAIADDVALGGNPTTTTQSTANSTTRIATTAFVQAAIDTDISALIDSAPGTLNTLNEIAAALNDDPSFTTTVNNAIALKAPIANPVFTGNATFDSPTLYVDGANNKVGIGNTVPSKKLHVEDSSGYQLQLDGGNNYWNVGAGWSGYYDGSFLIANNTGDKLVIDSDGDVGIGTSSPSNKLHLKAGASGASSFDGRYNLTIEDDGENYIGIYSPTNSYGGLRFLNAASSIRGYIDYYHGSQGDKMQIYAQNHIEFSYPGTGIQHIFKADGKVGIGTTSPGSYAGDADNLVIYSAGETGMTIASGTSSTGDIYFADGTSAQNRGFLQYHHADDSFRFGTAATERMRIGSSGQIGIGGTNYGSDGQILTSTGTGSAPAWEDAPSSGATSIDGLSDATTSETNSIMLGTATHGSISGAAQNTSVGIGAMDAITSAEYTVAIGYNAATALNSGSYNTVVGGNALITCTDGHSNTAIGMSALKFTSSGDYNTAVGRTALQANTTADGNTAVGYRALLTNEAGASNSAVGINALRLNVSKNYNTAMGKGALEYFGGPNANSDGWNTAVGAEAMGGSNSDDISYSNAFGGRALKAVISADYNNMFGYSAGTSITTGGSNTAMGHNAASSLTDAAFNVAIGRDALKLQQGATDNIAIGAYSMDGCNSASTSQVIAIGSYAASGALAGHNNQFIGYQSGQYATSAFYNTAVGNTTLKGSSSTAFTGDHNVAIGHNAAPNISSGYRNVCIGQTAGSGGTTFGYGVYLGMETAVSAANETNSIVIGNGATGKGSNTGFMSANGGANYAGNNSSSWSTTSDRRIKKNIEDNTTGLEALNQVRVRNFEYRTEDEIVDFDNPKAAVVEREGLQLGVIAQEIEEILPDVVTTLESGVKTVDPDNLTWYLINAVKELSAKNNTLEARIATLEG